MATEGISISWMIDAMEGQDISTSEITGNFLQTDYEKEDININTEVEMVILLKEIYQYY